MRFNPRARLDRGRVSDSRGGGRGGGMRLPIPRGGRAGGSIGGLLLVLVLFAVVQCSGLDLSGGGGPVGSPGGGFDTSRVAEEDTDRYAGCVTGRDAQQDSDCARIAVENSLYDYWSTYLPQVADVRFQPATMTTFAGGTTTACGSATSQVGPFYCPVDQGIYLDTSFFDQVLEDQLGGPGGAFVEPYVLAHEYGHHVQNLLGYMQRVRTQQGPRSDAVRLELQADCYAGLWTRAAETTEDAAGQVLIADITEQDVAQAMQAASAVGDDRIQQRTRGQVTEESWTHGSAESRMRWFRVGYDSGDIRQCEQVWQAATP